MIGTSQLVLNLLPHDDDPSALRERLTVPLTEPLAAAIPLEAPSEAALVMDAQAGNAEAVDFLFCRHHTLFLCHARRYCRDPCDAEDLCQEACFKAVRNLPLLRDPRGFRAWVLGFITNECRHWKRNFEKVGTPEPPVGTYIIEAMIVEPTQGSEEDVISLLDRLSMRARQMAEPFARIGAFMLDHFRQEQEFPTVRLIATATHCSQGAAQRGRGAVLVVFRRSVSALGF